MSLSESPLAALGALAVIALVTVPLAALTGYSLYLGAAGMVTADWTWAKAGAILLGSLTCTVPALLAFTSLGKKLL
jgi:hypothetical protein